MDHLAENAIHVPEWVWDLPEMNDALRARDSRRLFQLIQKHSGASQTRMGVAMGIAQGRISDYLHGRRRVESLAVWKRIADGSGMPEHARSQLGLDTGGRTHAAGSPAPVGPARPPILTPALSTDEVVGRMALRDLVSPVADESGQTVIRGDRLRSLVAKWTAPASRGLQVLELVPGQVGLEEIDLLEEMAVTFRQWDHQFGGGMRRKAVIGQLVEVADAIRDSHPSVIARRLHGVAGRIALTAAHMSNDVGMVATGQEYFLLALRAGQEARDSELSVRAANALSRHLLTTKHTADALSLIQYAIKRFRDRATPEELALLMSTEAWIHARRGDGLKSQRSLESAASSLERARSTKLFGQAELFGISGACHEILATKAAARAASQHAGLAEQDILKAVQLRDGVYVRSRALDLAGLANVYTVMREPERAITVGLQAIELMAQLRSTRGRQQIHKLASRILEQFPDVEGARELIQRVRGQLPIS